MTIVQRKAGNNVGILLHSPLSLLIPVFAVTLWWLLRPGGPLDQILQQRELRAGLSGLAVAGLIGFLVNDSGIAVPVAAGFVLVPLAISAAACRHRAVDADSGVDTPDERASSEPDRHTEGVSVNSRDSAGPAD
jgi:hypothetical protein